MPCLCTLTVTDTLNGALATSDTITVVKRQ
jgi:hypothetical protein